MDQEFLKVGLYPHNADSYRKVRDAFDSGENVVGIVQATGTGKTYQALQLALDNKDKKITYIVPSNAIIEHIESIIASNPNLDRERDFPNLEFRTYQSLVNMSREEIKDMNIDLLILDEFHHIGAPVWGSRVGEIIDTHENMKVFGMTAYTVRDRGTIYERDMALSNGNELFSDKIVNRYDLVDAMIDGVLPRPIYRSAYIQLFGIQKELEDKVLSGDANSKEYQEYLKILKDVKRRIEQAPGTRELVLKNIKKDGKYIYFCPIGSDLDAIMKEAKEWFNDFNQDDVVFYKSTSEDGDLGKYNRNCFYHDKMLDGSNADNKLRIIFVINQYNEGVHSLGIDGVILGRATCSDIVYFEQIGRALSVRGDSIKKHLNYEKLSIEELKNIATSRDINISGNVSKEEIINKLIAPVIIDLTNNIEFIKELEDNLQDRIKEYQMRKEPKSNRIINTQDFLFDIDLENQELFDILNDLRDRLYPERWEYMYNLAKDYYEINGNLWVKYSYLTSTGEKLGRWINTQRSMFNKGKLNKERIEKLELIEMRFETNYYDIEWNKMYEHAKVYYEENGDLEIPGRYVTSTGVKLGGWINNQRTNFNKNKLSQDRKEKLELIGMRLETKDNEEEWNKMYNLAKEYYQLNGDLEIPARYVTSTGVKLGRWIITQRFNLNKSKLKEERKEKLELIGMRLETKDNEEWNKMYNLAKEYYQLNGDLEVPGRYVTSTGVKLGSWINTQRRTFNSGKLSQDRKEKLELISMRLETKDNEEEWNKMYNLAKEYYQLNGDLEIPARYVTSTGVKLGSWISSQRIFFKNENLRQDRIDKLTIIGMRWTVKNKNILQDKFDLCMYYGIDYSRYKKELDKLSYQELYSKLCFLKDNDIPYIVNGELNNIFYMSSINMKVEYGYSLEELCLKYFVSSFNKSGNNHILKTLHK